MDYNHDPDNPKKWPNPEFEWEKSLKGLWEPSIHATTFETVIDPVSFIKSMHPQLTINTTTTFDQHLQSSKIHDNKVSFVDPKQSDSGANTTATNNLDLLHHVVYINPVNVS